MKRHPAEQIGAILFQIAGCTAALACVASAAVAAPRALTDQELIAYNKSPLGPIKQPRSFVLGTWGGSTVQVELGCSSACPKGESRLIYLAGVEIDSCTDVGAVLEERPRPGRSDKTPLCIPKPVWFEEQLAIQKSFSDRSLADFAASSVDLGNMPESDSVVGRYRGALVRIVIRCGLSCSMSAHRILYLEPPSGKACEQVGGVTRKRTFYGDMADTHRSLCIPRILDDV